MDHRIFLKTDLSVYHINGIQFLIRIAAYPVFSDYVFVCFVILVVRDMPDDLVLKFLLIAQTKFEQVAFRFDKVIDIHGSTRVKIIVIHTMIKEEHINAVSEQDRKDLRSSFPGDGIKYLVAVTNAQLTPQALSNRSPMCTYPQNIFGAGYNLPSYAGSVMLYKGA